MLQAIPELDCILSIRCTSTAIRWCPIQQRPSNRRQRRLAATLWAAWKRIPWRQSTAVPVWRLRRPCCPAKGLAGGRRRDEAVAAALAVPKWALVTSTRRPVVKAPRVGSVANTVRYVATVYSLCSVQTLQFSFLYHEGHVPTGRQRPRCLRPRSRLREIGHRCRLVRRLRRVPHVPLLLRRRGWLCSATVRLWFRWFCRNPATAPRLLQQRRILAKTVVRTGAPIIGRTVFVVLLASTRLLPVRSTLRMLRQTSRTRLAISSSVDFWAHFESHNPISITNFPHKKKDEGGFFQCQ